jgi:hypothetical protein
VCAREIPRPLLKARAFGMTPLTRKRHDSANCGTIVRIVRGGPFPELFGRQLKGLQDKREVPAKTFPRVSTRRQRKISKCLLKSGKERSLR